MLFRGEVPQFEVSHSTPKVTFPFPQLSNTDSVRPDSWSCRSTEECLPSGLVGGGETRGAVIAQKVMKLQLREA